MCKMHQQRQWSILHVLVCDVQNAPAKPVEHFACFGVWCAKAFCMFWCVMCKMHQQRQWSILHVLVCDVQNAPAKAAEHFACFGVWCTKCTSKGSGAFCMLWCATCKMHQQRQQSILQVLVCDVQHAPAKAAEPFACFSVWRAKCTRKGSGAFCMFWCVMCKMHQQRQSSILHVLVCDVQNAPAKPVEHFACFSVWRAKCTRKGSGAFCMFWCVMCKMHQQRQSSILHVLVCDVQNAPAKAVEHFACFGVWYAKCTSKGSGAFCMFWCVMCKMHQQSQWSILHVLVCDVQNAPAKPVEHFACFSVWRAKCTRKGSGAFCMFWCVMCKMHQQRQSSISHVLVCDVQNAPAKAVEHFACFGVWYAKCTSKGSGAFCMFCCVMCKMHQVCDVQNTPANAVEQFACFGVWYAKCTNKGDLPGRSNLQNQLGQSRHSTLPNKAVLGWISPLPTSSFFSSLLACRICLWRSCMPLINFNTMCMVLSSAVFGPESLVISDPSSFSASVAPLPRPAAGIGGNSSPLAFSLLCPPRSSLLTFFSAASFTLAALASASSKIACGVLNLDELRASSANCSSCRRRRFSCCVDLRRKESSFTSSSTFNYQATSSWLGKW